MSTYENSNDKRPPRALNGAKVLGGAAGVGLLFLAVLFLLTLSKTGILTWVFATNTTQATWYITRAAGLTSYLLLWLSTAWGLAVSSRVLDGKLHGSYTYDFHQFISLLAIGFIAMHVISLLFDQYLPFSILQVLLPFTSAYRPLWVAVGILSMYLVLLVTITFYIRDRIGQKAFRSIHVLSLVAFLGSAVHGLFSGTDSPLPSVQIMYAATFLSVIFLLTYWVVMLAAKKHKQQKAQ